MKVGDRVSLINNGRWLEGIIVRFALDGIGDRSIRVSVGGYVGPIELWREEDELTAHPPIGAIRQWR